MPATKRRVSARDARTHFAELTDQVHSTGEPVIVEKQGKPFVAVVSLADLASLDWLRGQKARDEFSRLAARAAQEHQGPEPSEEEIVEAVKATREAIYRERYGAT